MIIDTFFVLKNIFLCNLQISKCIHYCAIVWIIIVKMFKKISNFIMSRCYKRSNGFVWNQKLIYCFSKTYQIRLHVRDISCSLLSFISKTKVSIYAGNIWQVWILAFDHNQHGIKTIVSKNHFIRPIFLLNEHPFSTNTKHNLAVHTFV